jgi:hypothetical protein
MPALSERDMRVLAFERGTWRTAGAKEQAISEVLGITATRYYQLLNELIDSPEAGAGPITPCSNPVETRLRVALPEVRRRR